MTELAPATVQKSALTCADSGSPRSDWNRRPSDYESKSLRPAGAIAAGSGCSRQQGRPASAFLTCRVTAGGMTKRITRLSTEGRPDHGLPSASSRKVAVRPQPPPGPPTGDGSECLPTKNRMAGRASLRSGPRPSACGRSPRGPGSQAFVAPFTLCFFAQRIAAAAGCGAASGCGRCARRESVPVAGP